MIFYLKLSEINPHIARGPYIYHINDSDNPHNDEFLPKMKNYDIKNIEIDCCQIMKNDFDIVKHKFIKLNSLETCVVYKNFKILSFINPINNQIEELYSFMKKFTEKRQKESLLKCLSQNLDNKNLTAEEIKFLRQDIQILENKNEIMSSSIDKRRK